MHTRRLGPTLALTLALPLIGCAEEWGPVPMPTAPASGRVEHAGQPLSGGWLEFLPVDGTVGRLASARIGPDGRFASPGVPVGRVGLRVVAARPDSPEARLLGQGFFIRRDVPPGGAPALVIDLAVEAALQRAAASPAP